MMRGIVTMRRRRRMEALLTVKRWTLSSRLPAIKLLIK
jgi:hypothetical protein